VPPWVTVPSPVRGAAVRGTSVPCDRGSSFPASPAAFPSPGGVRGKDFSPGSSSLSRALSPAQRSRCSSPPFPPTGQKTDLWIQNGDPLPLLLDKSQPARTHAAAPRCRARRYPGCTFPWQRVLEKFFLLKKTHARGGFGLLRPPSPSLRGPSQLLRAPSQGSAAAPGSGPARGRAWVPALPGSAQTPANGGGEKSCCLWLRNSPAVGLPRESLAAGIAAGGIGRTPQSRRGLASPHQPAALSGTLARGCPHRGRVVLSRTRPWLQPLC